MRSCEWGHSVTSHNKIHGNIPVNLAGCWLALTDGVAGPFLKTLIAFLGFSAGPGPPRNNNNNRFIFLTTKN
jgi:hypothetical protein